MKTIIISIFAIGLLIFSLFSFSKPETNGHNGKCTGSANCTACSNCSRCGHCSAGGTCGVCSGSSSGRNFYSSNSNHKTSKSKKKTQSTNSPYKKSNAGVSGLKQKKQSSYTVYNDENEVVFFADRDIVNIYRNPGFDFPVIEKVKKGEKLIQLEQGEEWMKIKVFSTGTKGFVYKEYLR
ncbi:SH3 domain-containing protein [Epilithonimonas sp. UC225_85]|uniref:SH3 domain-containing protein n=1 Tax=Epilithonimonas sp. UC225_85 TaxID=3350167 RepID=UPI0036D2E033